MLLRPILYRPRWPLLATQCHTCHLFTTSNKVPQISTIRHISQVTSPNISLRLMPLGGSVTYGVGSSDGNGYRKFLQDMLLAQGYQVRFVGSRKSGSMKNNDNEGWRGYRLDQVASKARNSVATLGPNVFTINAGSNDCLQDYELDTFRIRMGDTLDYLWQESPRSTIILSTLLVNANKQVNSRVVRVNSQIRESVQLKAAEEKRIVLADMYSAQGPELSDLVDGTHPNDAGYRKMAEIWFNAIEQARGNHLFEK
ncbi:Ff.00g114450.m01.CDS01 [Fusarium sp. VM40]|nr:Ff.00g114450.m01.CDS01 [Fusarium sp. VM40]